MPVYAIVKQDTNTRIIVQEQFNLEKFGFFKRGTIKDFIKGMVKEVSKSLPKDSQLREVREKFNEKEQFKIIFQMRSVFRVFIITDIEYNSKIAYKLLDKCYENNANYEYLIKEYKQWEDKDQFKKIEDQLEKCNVIVMEGLSQILQRGESLSDLVEKSENLSMQTKILFKTAKKKNSCC
ncbi:uncharacterized protein VICG_01866 [Vittaforma corneae ATCC 50505]|uniref:V-SNARE coiled-coil homology domain-containing protein n=1 Tax=Vittaforma corneae (strain ATCC 50505) TaxID=993615 RepID=L2GJM7_VITCO|nr:uncharacterized protein VICG_01866 [Vittaforma corneae ATCC 50505]ELA41073.1 hypothetical protein VICG_01866 [Vittaforma corneae ATCC 50505]